MCFMFHCREQEQFLYPPIHLKKQNLATAKTVAIFVVLVKVLYKIIRSHVIDVAAGLI